MGEEHNANMKRQALRRNLHQAGIHAADSDSEIVAFQRHLEEFPLSSAEDVEEEAGAKPPPVEDADKEMSYWFDRVGKTRALADKIDAELSVIQSFRGSSAVVSSRVPRFCGNPTVG
jgi:hypothetical protein